MSVSYTHLDVYKRQTQLSVGGYLFYLVFTLVTFDQEEYTFLPFTILYVRTLTSVSYTHLDVYKRQICH